MKTLAARRLPGYRWERREGNATWRKPPPFLAGRAAAWLALLGLTLPLLLLASTVARAQGALPITRSYVTPFPDGDRYQLYVFGDSLADGIWNGLKRAFPPNTGMDVIRQTRAGSGLARVRAFNWNLVIDKLLNVNKVHLAVVMLGVSDAKTIRFRRRAHKFMTPEWKKIYAGRVDQMMKRLKRAKTAVYWVGLPIMANAKFNADMQALNDLVRERAFLNGVKFIDTWNGFTDQFGRFSAYGPDLSGRVRRLRTSDGIHFTAHGYRKLAHFVEQEIRKDLTAARQERDIPLAGDPEEQRRATGRADLGVAPEEGTKKIRRQKQAATSRARPGKTGQKARTRGKTAVPQVTRNPLHGETIANEMSIGLTALASVSSLNDGSTKEGHRRLPLEQRPYYRVLVKGDALRPKHNRADDFRWPPG